MVHPIKQSVSVPLVTTEGCFSHYQILYIPPDGKHIHTQTQAEVLQQHKSGESQMDETVSVQMSEYQYASVSASSLRSQVRNSWNLDTTSVCRVETSHPHVCVCLKSLHHCVHPSV